MEYWPYTTCKEPFKTLSRIAFIKVARCNSSRKSFDGISCHFQVIRLLATVFEIKVLEIQSVY